MRRLGKLEEVAPFLKQAEQTSGNNEAGLLYCKGLFESYNGNIQQALIYLNSKRLH